MISIKRPTGTFIQEYCLIEHNTNIKYDFTQNENTAAVEGFHDCQITLYDEDGGIVSTPRFTMIVNEKVINSDDINISDEDKTAIDNMIAAEVARQDAERERVQADAARRMELDAFKASVNAALDSSIPAVTAEDDGKFLRVVGDKWAAVSVRTYNGETEDVE